MYTLPSWFVSICVKQMSKNSNNKNNYLLSMYLLEKLGQRKEEKLYSLFPHLTDFEKPVNFSCLFTISARLNCLGLSFNALEFFRDFENLRAI